METILRLAVRLGLAALLFCNAGLLTRAASKTVTWVGNVNANWDITTANWTTGAAAATYAEGDAVIFDESTSIGDVNLTSVRTPSTVTVNTSGLTYRLAGPGSIGGAAALVKDGLWILILANDNNYSGGTTIQRGFLILGDGGTTGSLGSGNVTNNASLIINRTGALSLPNAISGRGSVTVSLNSTVTMTGANTYTNSTIVRAGDLILNGINSGGGLITNEPPATLSGRGANTGPVVISGALSPGDGIGTFTTGSLTLMPGATNIMDLGAVNTVGGGVNDLIVVNGNLTLNSNKLVLNVPQTPVTGVPYRLISYTGSRSGTFNPVLILNGSGLPPATLNYSDSTKTVNLIFQGEVLAPEVIYRETFGMAPGSQSDAPAKVFDWEQFDSQGAPATTVGATAGVNFSVNGKPTDVENVNAGPNSDGTFGAYPHGLLYFGPNPSPSIGFTTEYSFDPSTYVAGTVNFSWYEGNNNGSAAHVFRLLLRQGGTWYASDATFITLAVPLDSFGTDASLKTLTYSPVATNWWRVNFNGNYVPGATPGTGTTTASSAGAISLIARASTDLSGAITAFGMYGENGGSTTGNRRIDSFAIEAQPIGGGTSLRFSTYQFTQGSVILRAVNGAPNTVVRLMATTDVAAASGSWTQFKTANFDASGNVSFTNTVSAATPAQFYRLKSP